MITLLVLIFLVLCLLYTTDFQTSFRLARGKEAAHIVVPLDDPQWSPGYPMFWVGERDTQTILVTPRVPERLGSQAPLFVVDLQEAKFERFTPETVQFEIAQRLQPYIDRTASAKESNVLLRSADNRRASLSFSGLHLKLPVYRLAGFPEAARKGWEFVDSYSGTLRLEINSPEGNGIDSILQQRIFNKRTIPRLADIGFWMQDGKHFVFNAFATFDWRLFFLAVEKSENSASKGDARE